MSQIEGGATLKKDALGFGSVLIYGLLFMVPLAPIAVFGEVAKASNNLVPLVYLIACVAMTFTGISYYHFSKKFPMAGSVYTYVSKGVNPFVGFIVGWLILLDYFFIPALVYKTGGIYIADMLGGPYFIWSIVLIAIVTFINMMGIDNLSKVDIVCILLEVAALVIIIALAIHFLGTGGGYGGLSIEPLYKPDTITPSFIATACAIACLSFLGFDGISTLAEETIQPEKTIGKAVICAIIGAGLIFIIQTYFYQLCWGGKDPSVFDDAMGFFQVFDAFAPPWLYTMIQLILLVAIFANVLTAQASAARIMFGMGRDRNLPAIMAKISPKRQTPYVSTLVLGIASLFLVFIPYETLVLLVNLGAIVSFICLDLAVIYHFFIKEKLHTTLKHWIIYLVCPIIGAAILVFVLSGFSKATYIVFVCWFIVGMILLGVRTKGFKETPGQLEM